MEQDIETTTGASAIDRRDFIRKSAIVGGMVWAAPAMSTLGSRAFADNGTFKLEDDCVNFINFKIEQVGGVWTFVACMTADNPGSCVPTGYEYTGACIPGPGSPNADGTEGVTSPDGRVKLTVSGSTFTLWVAPGCEILQGGAVGGRNVDDPCVFFEPNGTAQTWDASVPQGDLSNIVGYICCDQPF